MDFTLNEDQELLKESVDRFVREAYTFDRRQALVASELGFSREHWKQFAELGWLALGFAEEHGGLGGSALDSAVLMEAFGRTCSSSRTLRPSSSAERFSRRRARMISSRPSWKGNCS